MNALDSNINGLQQSKHTHASKELPAAKFNVQANEKFNVEDKHMKLQSQMILNVTSNDKDLKRLLSDFLNSERLHSCIVNRKENFSTDDLQKIKATIASFMDSIIESNNMLIQKEEPCVKKILNINLIRNVHDDGYDDDNDNEDDRDDDSLGRKAEKLQKADFVIEKMKQRQESTTKMQSNGMAKTKEISFDEPSIKRIHNSPDTDEEIIIIEKLQYEISTESSGNSDDIVYGTDPPSNVLKRSENDLNTTTSTTLQKLCKNEPIEIDKHVKKSKTLIKSVTIDDSVRFIKRTNSDDSFILDNDTSINIRQKMMAYSVSENDSDFIEKLGSGSGSEGDRIDDKSLINYDNFNIKTILTDNLDTSTETESTIVSAATKIQANARGFLTRKKLGRRTLTSGTKSSLIDDSKTSIGTGAFSESIEHLVQDAAAKLIQNAYRKHYKTRKMHMLPKQTIASDELAGKRCLLAQRRLTLQRGDALNNDSTPDELSSSNSSNDNKPNELKNQTIKKKSNTTNIVHGNKKFYDTMLNWFSLRQNSMPVQIDSEVFRVIPKRLRKRIQSAENNEKKANPRTVNKSNEKP